MFTYFENTYIARFDDLDRDLVSLGRLNQTLIVTTSALVGNPARLLGIVRLGLELHLQLIRDDEPWGWIRIRSSRLLDVARHVDGTI